MTKFDWEMEKMQDRRQAERENQINAYLYARLRALSKVQAVEELIGGLTFIVGVGELSIQKQAVNEKQAVFF